jgi:hypothetical protein
MTTINIFDFIKTLFDGYTKFVTEEFCKIEVTFEQNIYLAVT